MTITLRRAPRACLLCLFVYLFIYLFFNKKDLTETRKCESLRIKLFSSSQFFPF